MKSFSEDLMLGMHKNLVKMASKEDNLNDAVSYLNSAVDIFEETNLDKQASQVLNILKKIASNKIDKHTKGLTSKKMISNLLDHGTEFNLTADGFDEDLLNLDLPDDLEVVEDETSDEDFEDEK